MNYKEFFRPTISRIVVFIVILLLLWTIFLPRQIFEGGLNPIGIPFKSFILPGSAISDSAVGATTWGFSITSIWGFIGNIIFWYIVACLIVLGFKKMKKK